MYLKYVEQTCGQPPDKKLCLFQVVNAMNEKFAHPDREVSPIVGEIEKDPESFAYEERICVCPKYCQENDAGEMVLPLGGGTFQNKNELIRQALAELES